MISHTELVWVALYGGAACAVLGSILILGVDDPMRCGSVRFDAESPWLAGYASSLQPGKRLRCWPLRCLLHGITVKRPVDAMAFFQRSTNALIRSINISHRSAFRIALVHPPHRHRCNSAWSLERDMFRGFPVPNGGTNFWH